VRTELEIDCTSDVLVATLPLPTNATLRIGYVTVPRLRLVRVTISRAAERQNYEVTEALVGENSERVSLQAIYRKACQHLLTASVGRETGLSGRKGEIRARHGQSGLSQQEGKRAEKGKTERSGKCQAGSLPAQDTETDSKRPRFSKLVRWFHKGKEMWQQRKKAIRNQRSNKLSKWR
jgi:hypothetical protein